MAKNKSKPDREYITSLERGLSVLRCFSREEPEMTISEISAVVGLNPAVVRRCLHTLLRLGYIGKQGKLFLLRPQAMSLGSAFLESMDVEETFRPTLQELSDKTGDTTSLAVLTDYDIMFLVYVSTVHTIHHYVGVGQRIPAYITAMGRALLAFRPKDELDNFMQELDLKIYTEKTIPSKARLKQVLKQVNKLGYACAQGEMDPNIISLAVPVFGHDGEAVAAINCSTTTVRMEKEAMIATRLGPLREAAKKIEVELRRHPLLTHSISSRSWGDSLKTLTK
ncbi:MAG: IclR family transcriptional regulator C-terminal domain-containing protein [Pseudomonadales bacterium]|nr:IclR family transcriptional regulator C-terminal domain-containing protein [Pseudomonadales bacterium]